VRVAKLVICPEAEICHIALEAYQQVDTGLQKQKYMINVKRDQQTSTEL
jgi:hypothetical protein